MKSILIKSLPLMVGFSTVLFLQCAPGREPTNALCRDFSGVCMDLSPWAAKEGSGAKAKLAGASDLLKGQAAQSRPGDFVLENDKIKVIVQQMNRAISVNPWGGNLIDAEPKREASKMGREAFGEAGLLLNFGRTLIPEQIDILADGSEGGAAILAVTGRDTINDFFNLPGAVEEVGLEGDIWLHPDVPLDLRITNYYILNPGEERVRMVTAMRNDGDTESVLVLGDLIDRGGNVDSFNPERNHIQRFGNVEDLPEMNNAYIGMAGQDIAYGFAPVGVPGREGDPNLSFSIRGISALVTGAEDLLDFLGAEPEDLPFGTWALEPGDRHVVVRDFYVGKDLAAVHAAISEEKGEVLGAIEGTVESPDGGELPRGTRVAALVNGRLVETVFYVEDGAFSGRLPEGSYDLLVDAPGFPLPEMVPVTVAAGQPQTLSLSLPQTALVHLKVTDNQGNGIPARAAFECDGECEENRSTLQSRFRDADFDDLANNLGHLEHLGPSGEATVRIRPGSYGLVVGHGAEWSVFPHAFPNDEHRLNLNGGDEITVEVELSQVLDTTGWVSADLHVHGINSPDALVEMEARVLAFLAEGVDVMVSTDHDFVTDYGPTIAQVGASDLMASVAGNEISEFGFAHYNAFPLHADPNAVNGGALDWARDEKEPPMTPGELYEAVRQLPGANTKVIQINHARGSQGLFRSIGLDTATFKSTFDPTRHRIEVEPLAPDDWGLFDTSFTAMELMNGAGMGGFSELLNDWFAFMQRGLFVTGTAVSDTHRLYSGESGTPRSWVNIGTEYESPASFNEEAFAEAINAGKLTGGNGAFLKITATDGTQEVGLGETLALGMPGAPVFVNVEIQVASWFGVNQLDLYANIEGTSSRPGEPTGGLPQSTLSHVFDLEMVQSVPGFSTQDDPDTPHRRFVLNHQFELNPTQDTWIVILARGDTNPYPALLSSRSAIAFSNPVFIDADGDGVFTPPEEIGPVLP
jgi:hypothetical protein